MTGAAAEDACPCDRRDAGGRPLSFASCCGRYMAGPAKQPAPDAQSLMRSRYTAFVREDAAYLLATWHPAQRPPGLVFEPGLKWLGLRVRDHRALDADHAEVEFVARSRLAGKAHRLHERSRFVREGGGWYYVDGTLL